MPERSNDTPPSQSWPDCIRAVLVVALGGSLALAAGESGVSGAMFWRRFESLPPLAFITAGLGRIFVTHLVVWLPALAITGILLRTVRRNGATVTVLLGGFVVVAGLLTGIADLNMIYRDSPVTIAAMVGAALIVVGIVAVAARLCRRWIAPSYRAKAFNVLLVLLALPSIGLAVMFVRSPLWNPGGFAVDTQSPRRAMPTTNPHVLWIVLDTVRADRMSCYGYEKPTTPFLDQWSERCIVFDRTIANGIWTVPNHAAMFTGRSVREHGTDHPWYWLDDRLTTAAEVFSQRGYATASLSNNPWISPEFNFTRGFQTAHVLFYWERIGRSAWDHLLERIGWTPPLPWLDRDHGAAFTNWYADQWLDAQIERGDPVFLFVNLMEAHLPYRIPKIDRSVFLSPEQVARSYALRWSVHGNIMDAMDTEFNLEGSDFIDDDDIQLLRSQYDACVRYLDRRTRELIEMFDRKGFLDDTLVVVTSDHGEYLDTHGLWGHRFKTYNDVSHVAMLVHEPGRAESARVDAPVQLSDLFETVLSFGHDAESETLFDIARSPEGSRIAVTEFNGPADETRSRIERLATPRAKSLALSQTALQDRHFKFIALEDGARELYDLSVDPSETSNLAEHRPAILAEWEARYEQWQRDVTPFEPTLHIRPDLPPNIVETLKSLGYLGGADR